MHKKTETVAKLTGDDNEVVSANALTQPDKTTSTDTLEQPDTKQETDTPKQPEQTAQTIKSSPYPAVQDADPIPDSPYEYPTYRNKTPDPNAPDSPEVIVVLTDDGTPLTYRKVQDPNDLNKMIYIEDSTIPLATPEMKKMGHWALLNLIMTLVSVFAAVVVIFKKRGKEEEKRRDSLKIYNAAFALLSVVVFVLTENMRLPMVFADHFTFLMIVLALLQIPGILLKQRSKEQKA